MGTEIPAGIIAVNNTGAITLVAPLVFSVSPQITVLLEALDGVHAPPLCALCLQPLVITIIETNRPPQFSDDNVTVTPLENHSLAIPVATVNAIDATYIGTGLTFAILSVSPAVGGFRIANTSATSADIFLTAALDFEIHQSYEIVISASDQGNLPIDPVMTATATVHVLVGDVNDIAPSILSSSFTTFFTRAAFPSQLNLNIAATDPELGRNGLSSFRIVDRNDTTVFAASLFNISSSFNDCSLGTGGATTCTATITTTGDTCGVVTEANGDLRFDVIAFDDGNPSLESSPSEVSRFCHCELSNEILN